MLTAWVIIVLSVSAQEDCYDQGPCWDGYMDRTDGDYVPTSLNWACRYDCTTGGYYVNWECDCACVPATSCAPTTSPTMEPSFPTESPTDHPTETPTTPFPSTNTTMTPAFVPSNEPTIQPTSNATMDPSAPPTFGFSDPWSSSTDSFCATLKIEISGFINADSADEFITDLTDSDKINIENMTHYAIAESATDYGQDRDLFFVDLTSISGALSILIDYCSFSEPVLSVLSVVIEERDEDIQSMIRTQWISMFGNGITQNVITVSISEIDGDVTLSVMVVLT